MVGQVSRTKDQGFDAAQRGGGVAVGVAVKVKLAVPTGLPCWLTMKLADWARAAGAEAIRAARSAASERRVSLRMGLCIIPDGLDTGWGVKLHGNWKRNHKPNKLREAAKAASLLEVTDSPG
jgi:hypothetical protein